MQLNGSVKRDPESPARLGSDQIEVRGEPVRPAGKIYLMLNKRRGLVTTASDEKGRATIYSKLSSELPWVGPVGRLDKASEGLLLLTNDPEWAAAVTAPESHLAKIYHVQVSGLRSAALPESLVRGFRVRDEGFLKVKAASILRKGERNTWLEIILEEGKNRHIRRMLEHLGIGVLRLVRVSIGPLALGDLAKGAFRPLTAEEKSAIERALGA